MFNYYFGSRVQKIGAPRAEQILHQVLFLWGLFFSALRAAVEEGPNYTENLQKIQYLFELIRGIFDLFAKKVIPHLRSGGVTV